MADDWSFCCRTVWCWSPPTRQQATAYLKAKNFTNLFVFETRNMFFRLSVYKLQLSISHGAKGGYMGYLTLQIARKNWKLDFYWKCYCIFLIWTCGGFYAVIGWKSGVRVIHLPWISCSLVAFCVDVCSWITMFVFAELRESVFWA